MKKIFFLYLGFFNALFAASQDADNSQGSSNIGSILILVLFFVVFYFFMIRPQMKKNKDQKKMLSAIANGDEVLTTSGIFGRIVKVSENSLIELEISENVIIKIQKSNIANILPKGSIK